MRLHRIALAFTIVAIAGCTKEPDCGKPLSDYCAAYGCKSYDDTVADIRARVASSPCYYAVVGTCGNWRFTSESGGFGGPTSYFDANGTLIGVYATTDVSGPGTCEGNQSYGDVPTCQQMTIEYLCYEGVVDAGRD